MTHLHCRLHEPCYLCRRSGHCRWSSLEVSSTETSISDSWELALDADFLANTFASILLVPVLQPAPILLK